MRSYRRHCGRQVLVTSGDITFAGRLVDARRDQLELADAHLVAEDGRRTPLEGLLLVEGAGVRWVQVL
ncbi:hypothetical protein [Micromonospora craniellae]|uniref:Uncharacterized protein n=1 Tax=Micromonospora craniellae TaxID=2294034 RepID=A0A372G2M7_9ACTN|nr:hypothetical protein [Micromonospora craniellae]QOC89872.1 hypothetical protein ID554_16675 [Micromonospora craniellae]RFS47016.1 hypothetical protein D0Q02_07590 [Micromonospora craniellae]